MSKPLAQPTCSCLSGPEAPFSAIFAPGCPQSSSANQLVGGRASGGHVPSLLLTHMQERASRLRKELLRHAPTPEAAPYLAACVHETLRLWPVAAQGSMRTPLADIDLPDGTCIPRGSM